MIIPLTGDWDISRRDDLDSLLKPAYDVDEVVFDLTQARYIGSALLTALCRVQTHRQANRMSHASIAAACPMIRRVLRIAGMEDLFAVCTTLDEAIAAENVAPSAAEPVG